MGKTTASRARLRVRRLYEAKGVIVVKDINIMSEETFNRKAQTKRSGAEVEGGKEKKSKGIMDRAECLRR